VSDTVAAAANTIAAMATDALDAGPNRALNDMQLNMASGGARAAHTDGA
jgi:hypothetical protein